MPHSIRQDARIERYHIDRSPLAQKPTQRDIALLLGETRDDLRRLVNYKDSFIVRRKIIVGKKKKLRELAYPYGRLRAVHERLKFHLNKIKQPSYLYSPRRNRGQRDNALLHLDQAQYLTFDLRQFYPSTTEQIVKNWFRKDLNMYGDVAGLLTHLSTIDGKVSFGPPVTPVLCSLIHRSMFDQIATVCERRGLRYSVWVDDLTVSGRSCLVQFFKRYDTLFDLLVLNLTELFIKLATAQCLSLELELLVQILLHRTPCTSRSRAGGPNIITH